MSKNELIFSDVFVYRDNKKKKQQENKINNKKNKGKKDALQYFRR